MEKKKKNSVPALLVYTCTGGKSAESLCPHMAEVEGTILQVSRCRARKCEKPGLHINSH